MEVTLPSDLEGYVRDLVESGEFDAPEAVVEKAVRLLRAERQRVLDLIQEGIDAADRGEVRDGPEFMRELMARYPEDAKVPEPA